MNNKHHGGVNHSARCNEERNPERYGISAALLQAVKHGYINSDYGTEKPDIILENHQKRAGLLRKTAL